MSNNARSTDNNSKENLKKKSSSGKYNVTDTRTSHLVIRTMTEAEVELLIEEANTEEERETFRNLMLAAKENPDYKDWYLPKIMLTRKHNVRVGAIGFYGPAKDESVKMYFVKREEYDGDCFMEEAVKQVSSNACTQKGIWFVEADLGRNDDENQAILAKVGFKAESEEGGIIHYVLPKPKGNWISFYLCIGLAVGLTLSNSVFKSATMGVSFGVAFGLIAGLIMDKKEAKKLQEHIKIRQEHLGN